MLIQFPGLGLDRSMSLAFQPPFSTPDCLNVRPRASGGRRRGGSRPGTGLALAQTATLGNAILGLHDFAYIPDQSNPGVLGTPWKIDHESFDCISLTSAWNNPPHQSDGNPTPLPLLVGVEQCAYAKAGENRGGAKRIADQDGSLLFVVEAFIVPYAAKHGATYSVYAGLDGFNPNGLVTGLILDLQIDANNSYVAQLRHYSSGTLERTESTTGSFTFPVSGWLRIECRKDNPRFVRATFYNQQLFYWNNYNPQIATNGPAHGVKINVPSNGTYGLIDSFRVQYTPDTGNDNNRETRTRRMLVAISDGEFWRDRRFSGHMETVPSTTINFQNDRVLDMADHYQKVYIADYGPVKISGNATGATASSYLTATGIGQWDNLGLDKENDLVEITSETFNLTSRISEIRRFGIDTNPERLDLEEAAGSHSNLTFRILRGPKVYNPNNSAGNEFLDIWETTDGVSQIPLGCPLLCRWSGRMVLAGYPPHVWYMSRVEDPTDFDFAQTDVLRAVASTSGEAGQIGDPITALIPYTDDYLIFGCTNSIWIMRGDPAIGGRVDNVSRETGIAIRNGWCRGPSGDLYFLSDDGMYGMANANAKPEALSRGKLPDELRRLSEPNLSCCMVYDAEDFGIAIHLYSPTASRRHWWFDLEGGGYWPMSLPEAKTPRVSLRHSGASALDSGTIFGCQDGWIRRYSRRFTSDEGSTINSHVLLGPLRIGNGDTNNGVLQSLDCKLDSRSGNVGYGIYTGKTAQESVEATASRFSGTWKNGLNYRTWPMVEGNSAIIKLFSENLYTAWQMETITAEARDAGPQRIP